MVFRQVAPGSADPAKYKLAENQELEQIQVFPEKISQPGQVA